MSGFIDWLRNHSVTDSKIRAELRRSLAFEPGEYPRVFPYVEPFVKGDTSAWQRKVHYLVAGLWANHPHDASGTSIPIGKACALHQAQSGSTSSERRFITLLDADSDQLPHRLRQMVALLKEYKIDWEKMLGDLRYWNSGQKRTQNRWARDFYQSHQPETEEHENTEKENTQ